MDIDMSGKVVVVTGGANGIGAALARGFAERGAKVAIGDLDGAKAAELGAELGGMGARLDVADERLLCQFLMIVERQLGPLDVYISNAGLGVGDGPGWGAGDSPNAAWDMCWQVNVMGAVYAARHVAPGMVARGGGVFAIVASAAGLLNQIGDAAYTATKHAAVSFAESLSITHGDDGLQVHCVCPEGVNTDLVKGIEQGSQGASGYIEPEDVAAALFKAMRNKTFRVYTHPNTHEYAQMRVAETDRWLGGMRKLRRGIVAALGRPM